MSEELDPVAFDVFRLDCAVDALREADLTPYRDQIERIASNLQEMKETA